MNPALPAALFFLPDLKNDSIEPLGTGNVNDTYLVTPETGKPLVLQRLSPTVFSDPHLVQHNMRLVCNHLNRAIQQAPELNNQFIPLILYSGKEGDTFIDRDASVWRMVNCIPGKTFETIRKPTQAEELGRCLGLFHLLLSRLDTSSMGDTLPGFHDTAAYLDKYDSALENSDHDHGQHIASCHSFIAPRRPLASLLDNAQGLSRTFIHGDPKVANFIFNEDNNRVISLIDLDTVRYGLLLHDIGDALRSCCNPQGESLQEHKQVYFDQQLFSAWLNGYNGTAELLLTNADKEHIVQAVQVITFELGLRFVTDYLTGNHYFKTSYPKQNLERANVQFKLVESLEKQHHELVAIVQSVCG